VQTLFGNRDDSTTSGLLKKSRENLETLQNIGACACAFVFTEGGTNKIGRVDTATGAFIEWIIPIINAVLMAFDSMLS